MLLTAVGNHFYNYVTKNPNTATIFVVLEDEYKELNLECIRKLTSKVNILPIIVTDVKDKPTRDFMDKIAESRVFQVPKSGYLSALLCVIPLQRLAYDLTIALGFDPDRPRNLAKELTTK